MPVVDKMLKNNVVYKPIVLDASRAMLDWQSDIYNRDLMSIILTTTHQIILKAIYYSYWLQGKTCLMRAQSKFSWPLSKTFILVGLMVSK